MNPADEERESAYNTAENLNKQLDDLGNTLSDMIKEINSTKGAEDDDDDENTVIRTIYISMNFNINYYL